MTIPLAAWSRLAILWWHSRRVRRDEVAIPVARLSFDLESDREGLCPALARGWPVRPPVIHSYTGQNDPADVYFVVIRSLWEREGKWLCLHYFWFSCEIDPKPRRHGVPPFSPEDETDGAAPPGAIITVASVCAPHAVFVAATALPPVLWLAVRSRRLYVRRRRRRLGLCLRCGYDLRGNTSGRCSECGGAVEAVRRVTA